MTIRMSEDQVAALQRKLDKSSPERRSAKPPKPLRRSAEFGEISTFTIYVSPKADNINQLDGWRRDAGDTRQVAYGRKKFLREVVEQAVMGKDIPSFKKPCLVLATYYYNSKRGPDQSNLGKGLLDALQHVGIIPGDDPSSLLPWLPETVRDAKGIPRIEVTVRDLRGLTKAGALTLYNDRLDRMLERYF